MNNVLLTCCDKLAYHTCCDRLAYHTCCLMNKVADFVFRHLSTTQGDGGKLRQTEREREREKVREKILRSKFSCPRMLIHGVHKARTLVYADHASILWYSLQSDVTFTSALQGLVGATKHDRRLQISSITAKWARFLARLIPVNVTSFPRKD